MVSAAQHHQRIWIVPSAFAAQLEMVQIHERPVTATRDNTPIAVAMQHEPPRRGWNALCRARTRRFAKRSRSWRYLAFSLPRLVATISRTTSAFPLRNFGVLARSFRVYRRRGLEVRRRVAEDRAGSRVRVDASDALRITSGHLHDSGVDCEQRAVSVLESALTPLADGERNLIAGAARVRWPTENLARHQQESAFFVEPFACVTSELR